MPGAVASNPRGNDFSALAQKRPKGTRVLVVDGHRLVGAEPADFPAAQTTGTPRWTRRSTFSSHRHLDTLPVGELEVGTAVG